MTLRKDEEIPRDRIMLQSQARRGKAFSEGADRYVSIDQSGQIGHRLAWSNRGARRPWDDLCTHGV